MTSAKAPTLITASKKTASQKVAELTPQEKLALLPPAQQDMLKEKAHVVEPTTIEPTTTVAPTKPKSKMSWAEKMAALPEDERAAARAKAAEQSRISKAKARGTTPGIAATMRLKAQLARNIERTELLAADRAKIEAELAEIEAQIVAEQAETEVENGQA